MNQDWQMIDPVRCTPPHRVTHPEKYELLVEMFKRDGCWGDGRPVLLSYRTKLRGNKIQLLSGSHRWAAAKTAGIQIPVCVKDHDFVIDLWGKPEWVKMMDNPPVFQLDGKGAIAPDLLQQRSETCK